MRVVITGATGNVGTAVLRALADEPEVETIVGIARRRPAWSAPKTTWAQADVARDELDPHLAGADAVVHLAWLIQPSRDERVTRAVNVEGSARVFAAAARAGVGTLVHASSVGAYAPGPKDRAVDESWPTTGIASSFYSRHKAAAERALDDLESAHPRLRVVRLRPALIFQRAAASEIRRLFAGPFLPTALLRHGVVPVVPRHPRLRVQAIHADDVADAYRRALVRDVRGAFNVAAEPVLDGEAFRRALGARATVPVPARALRAAAALTWRARLQPSEPGWLDLGLGTPLLATDRARAELGLAPRRTATDALEELLDGLRNGAGGPTPPLDPEARGPARVDELRTGVGARGETSCAATPRTRGRGTPHLDGSEYGQAMAQEHLDRLTALDASFLAQEGPDAHMHVGAVALFEGPPPAYDELLDSLRMRLHLVPRYRQRLSVPPAGTGRPLWVDDDSFSLEYHVRQTALPRPGSEEQLMLLAARIFSQQLDRSKPLWELWLVEGVEGDSFALISKTHHAMIDGVAGVDLLQVIFDLGPVPAEIPHPDEAWEAEPEPGGAELAAASAVGAVRTGVATVARALTAATRPGAALSGARDAVEGIGEIVWAGLNPAPATPLNVEIGPHRRFVGVRAQLQDFKLVKDSFGGTVNDVVLTVVSGALRTWLASRGVRTQGLELRALVPVSIRAKDEQGALGNRIAAMRGPLPVYIEDPLVRLDAVRAAMDGLKESKQAVGAEVLAGAQNFAPPTILAQASRLNFSTRLFNLIVTNVPGPQFPLYVRGREMLDIFPVAFLPKNHALAIAIMSYNGRLNFGLLADYDALPDVGVVADGISAALAELVALARAEGGPTPRSPGRTSRPRSSSRVTTAG